MSSKIFFPSSPVPIKLKDSDSNGGALTDLRTALSRYCPAVLQKFTPSWWLFSGHSSNCLCRYGKLQEY
ncbi:hypothetical protein BDZ89DRAFT_1077457 [Hymenopellis radicata]|nr:hypothetical protein BDZ89DRAFT_1077457 [Hymenopellis radicata]